MSSEMTRLNKSLQELRNSARQMNELTDEVNRQLKTVEDYLVESGIGIEHWVRLQDDQEGCSFGLAKLQNGWRLCVSIPDEENAFGADYVRPWDNCSRALKMAAAKALPELVESIQAEVAQRLGDANAAQNALAAFFTSKNAK